MKELKIFITLFLWLLLSVNKIFAQENNLSEDYSQYLPEVRAFYKKSGNFPKMTVTPEVIKRFRGFMGKPEKKS